MLGVLIAVGVWLLLGYPGSRAQEYTHTHTYIYLATYIEHFEIIVIIPISVQYSRIILIVFIYMFVSHLIGRSLATIILNYLFDQAFLI